MIRLTKEQQQIMIQDIQQFFQNEFDTQRPHTRYFSCELGRFFYFLKYIC